MSHIIGFTESAQQKGLLGVKEQIIEELERIMDDDITHDKLSALDDLGAEISNIAIALRQIGK